jgi:hypothetical protein
VDDAVDRLLAGRAKLRARKQTNRQVCPRPLEAQRIEALDVEAVCRVRQRGGPLVPSRDRIGFVEPAYVRDLLPELFECLHRRKLGEHEPRPELGRARDDCPVGRSVADHRQELLDERELVAPGPFRVEIVEQARRRRAGQRDPGRPLLADREHSLREPGGHELERVVGRVGDSSTLDVGIEVLDVDELRPAGVSALGDRPSQLVLRVVGPDGDDLSGLDVGGERDREVGELVRQVGTVHGGEAYARGLGLVARYQPTSTA